MFQRQNGLRGLTLFKNGFMNLTIFPCCEMERLNQMIHDGWYWYDLMRYAIQREKPLSDQMMDRIHGAMMEDEGFGRRGDPKILERMWNKIQYRMDFRNLPIREIRDWVDDAFDRAVITGDQHNELMMRLAEELHEREKRRPGWRDEIIARHC